MTSQPVRRHLDFGYLPPRYDGSSGALGPHVALAIMPILAGWHYPCQIAQGGRTSE
jgi:hypothetical protein